jgi:hypothetical protein
MLLWVYTDVFEGHAACIIKDEMSSVSFIINVFYTVGCGCSHEAQQDWLTTLQS